MEYSLVFVYGTLCQGQSNHGLLKSSQYIGPAHTAERMVLRASSAWGIPFAGRDMGISVIHGELYKVDADTLARLDDLEGVSLPHGYRREQVPVVADLGGRRLYMAEMYFCHRADMPLVPSGRWQDAQLEQSDDVWYFAYGSNQFVDQMKSRKVYFSRRLAATAHGYAREFTKKADDPQKGAYATLRPLPTSKVPGTLYRIPAADLAKLDRAEGVSGRHYERCEVEVTYADGAVQRAITYIACPERIQLGLHVNPEYAAKIIVGGADLHGPSHEMEGTVWPALGVERCGHPAEGWSDGYWNHPTTWSDNSLLPKVRTRFTLEDFYGCCTGVGYGHFYPGTQRLPEEGIACAWEVVVDGFKAWLYKDQDSSTRMGIVFETWHPMLGSNWLTKYWNADPVVPGGFWIRVNHYNESGFAYPDVSEEQLKLLFEFASTQARGAASPREGACFAG
jgi:gamma-glutamylaminecyclotransferase